MPLLNTKTIQEWNQKFDFWSQAPSQTEQDKCDNAERMIRDAITACPAFQNRDITVFAQGSYRNRTNIRLESDVDICVLSKDTFYPDYSHAPDVNNNTFGFQSASYNFDALKQDLENALVAKFGRVAVKRGKKAFDIKENTYRVSADVVPAFEGRLYQKQSDGRITYRSGTVIRSDDDGRQINNWPQQHYDKGIEKHEHTGRQFKKKARILKNLRCDMVDDSIESAKNMSSFLLESLVFNCPDHLFGYGNNYDGMKAIIAHLWSATVEDAGAKDMIEVNDIKYLFRSGQPWRRADVHQFLADAWQYEGFGG